MQSCASLPLLVKETLEILQMTLSNAYHERRYLNYGLEFFNMFDGYIWYQIRFV